MLGRDSEGRQKVLSRRGAGEGPAGERQRVPVDVVETSQGTATWYVRTGRRAPETSLGVLVRTGAQHQVRPYSHDSYPFTPKLHDKTR